MSRSGRNRLSILLATIVLGLSAALCILFWQHAWLSLQVALAEEQTEIFNEMSAEAIASDNPTKAASCLEYCVNYYPSGSKQDVGSHLDKIVERQRSTAIRDIIADLRKKTGQDLGNDPQAWIKKYLFK